MDNCEKNSNNSKSSNNTENCCKVMTYENGKKFFCLMISGEIEGHEKASPENKVTKYEYVIPKLVEADQDTKIQGILILINTTGGDVEAGLSIAETIAGITKPTASIVLGGGHSIGVPLAVSAQKTYISKSATMIIHPVRMTGTTLGVPQSLEHFERMQERISNFVTEKSKITKQKFKSLMMNTEQLVTDIGTVLDSENAVKCGLIDKIGTISDALKFLQNQKNI